MTNPEPYILPRVDLQIKAFRKYERIIADACIKDLIIDPATCFPRRMAPNSFVARFSDARLAYRKYSYPSDIIPKGFNTDFLKAQAMSDGKVIIKCTNRTEQSNATTIEEMKAELYGESSYMTEKEQALAKALGNPVKPLRG